MPELTDTERIDRLERALTNVVAHVDSAAGRHRRHDDVQAIAADVEEREVLTTTITAEPLTYRRDDTEHSYFVDLASTVVGSFPDIPGAVDRLTRHAQEMEVVTRERQERAWRSIRAGEVEYRVEPNRTPGEGGYFAPPSWLVELFATAKRPGRVLAGLASTFDLPNGVSSVNLPILNVGTVAGALADDAGVPASDITDSAGSSSVVTISGQVDAPIQMLELSPPGAALDWALFNDLNDAADSDLETQLLYGTGPSYNQLTGVTAVSGINTTTYTDGSPTGSEMYPYFGQAASQLANARRKPPQCWLMRTARWSWLTTSEDTAGRPFGLSPFFIGNDVATPDPIGGLLGWPVFLDEALPATLGTGGNQDEVICLRPRDLILLEGVPQTNVFREVLSGSLGVRIQMHKRVAAITDRYPSSIASVGGSGFVLPESF